ncbi:MAG: phosphoglycerate kinase [Candidatus Komeilibacteria bacterium]|nr:phosphoglycerate kinase [Candidatus Komeilibacteria bacterium]
MHLRTIRSILRLNGKRVLVRCDLNASITNGSLGADDLWKLKSVIPTIRYLRRKKARIILVSHRGRPKGYDHDLTLAPIVKKLSSLLGVTIPLWHSDFDTYEKRSKELKPGAIGCLENIRFNHGEERNDERLGRSLARLADIYVDDAFGNIHRTHASMVAVTRFLPSYAGLLVQYEVEHLQGLLQRARHPIVAVIGGNKISTKILLIKKLLRRVDWVLLGGALANTVLAAMDYKIGRSIVEEDMRSWSKSILHNKLKVPLDARVAPSIQSSAARYAAIGAVRDKEMILDLGPDTIAFYASILKLAKTVVWNGPVGYFEDQRFAVGTKELVKVLTHIKAKAYVGGGETVKAVLEENAEDKVRFISTGGGAMLSLLEGRPLPALRALQK